MPDLSDPDDSARPVAPPRTYLGWGIAATVLCFLPLGLVALYEGIGVDRAIADGQPELAARRSRRARRWLVATIVVGVVIWLVIGVAMAMLGAFSPA